MFADVGAGSGGGCAGVGVMLKLMLDALLVEPILWESNRPETGRRDGAMRWDCCLALPWLRQVHQVGLLPCPFRLRQDHQSPPKAV